MMCIQYWNQRFSYSGLITIIFIYKIRLMKQWLTLTGFCFVHFANGIGFGIYTNNLQFYAQNFHTTMQAMENTFYIGLVTQILLCLPAIRLIEWRLDYAIISSGYLTVCSYLLQYFCDGNIVILVAALALNALAQLFLLPSPLYIAEKWFPLEQRPVVIGIQFYSNLLGFGLGGIMSSLLSSGLIQVKHILLIQSCIAVVSFVICILTISNQPDVRIQSIKKVQWSNAKDLWKQRYTAYNIVMASVFLGVSWTFLGQFYILQSNFPNGASMLVLVWILSGAFFGITMSWIVQKRLTVTGNYRYYDHTCKITLFVGILGNIILGTLFQLQIFIFQLYLFAVILIGVGTTGYFGLAFMSLIESIYPVPVLLIGTIIALFASVYSIISTAITQLFPFINAYFSIVGVTLLPFLYYTLTYETSFKRYKYYLNEKQSKFELLRIEEMSDNKSATQE